jgi:hypothetical protein
MLESLSPYRHPDWARPCQCGPAMRKLAQPLIQLTLPLYPSDSFIPEWASWIRALRRLASTPCFRTRPALVFFLLLFVCLFPSAQHTVGPSAAAQRPGPDEPDPSGDFRAEAPTVASRAPARRPDELDRGLPDGGLADGGLVDGGLALTAAPPAGVPAAANGRHASRRSFGSPCAERPSAFTADSLRTAPETSRSMTVPLHNEQASASPTAAAAEWGGMAHGSGELLSANALGPSGALADQVALDCAKQDASFRDGTWSTRSTPSDCVIVVRGVREQLVYADNVVSVVPQPPPPVAHARPRPCT